MTGLVAFISAELSYWPIGSQGAGLSDEAINQARPIGSHRSQSESK
jgi:hypothetical protein